MDERGGSGVFEEVRKAGLAVALFLASCATPATKSSEVAERERLLLALRAQNAAYVRQIEELQNRVFILEDRLDSRRVEAERRAAPQLPPPAVVTLSPRPHPAEPAGLEAAPAPGVATAPAAVASGAASAVQEPARPLTHAQQRAAARAMRRQLADLKAEEQRREKEQWGEDVPEPPSASAKLPKGSASNPAPRSSRPAPSPASGVGPSGPEEAAEEPEIPDGPTLSIETPVEYVGDAAVSASRPVLRLAASEPAAKPATSLRPRSFTEKARPLVLYLEALEALRAHDHARALVTFRRFLALHPHHDYADNAQYWMGECFYDRGDYPHAAEEFRRVVDRYPHGNKVPDALLKLGFSLAAAGDTAGATKVLASLVKAFPRHQAARLAAEKLAAPAVETPPMMPVSPGGPAPRGPSLKAEASFGPSLSALLPVFPAKPPGPESP